MGGREGVKALKNLESQHNSGLLVGARTARTSRDAPDSSSTLSPLFAASLLKLKLWLLANEMSERWFQSDGGVNI